MPCLVWSCLAWLLQTQARWPHQFVFRAQQKGCLALQNLQQRATAMNWVPDNHCQITEAWVQYRVLYFVCIIEAEELRRQNSAIMCALCLGQICWFGTCRTRRSSFSQLVLHLMIKYRDTGSPHSCLFPGVIEKQTLLFFCLTSNKPFFFCPISPSRKHKKNLLAHPLLSEK